MTKAISQRELRNDSGEVMRAVEAGESFVVTRNGAPLALLSPLRRRTFVSRAELLATGRSLGRIDYAQFRADVDAALDQSLP
jgi:prevent-host-death family protein